VTSTRPPRWRRLVVRAVVCCAAAWARAGRPAYAQGVTGAALQGRVLAPDGAAVAEAGVLVTNTATGERWRGSTTGGGRYAFERLSVGGLYRLEVRAIGFAPALISDLALALGERRRLDVILSAAPDTLPALVVHASRAPPGGHTGPSRVIGADELARLPLLNRDVLDLVRESPQAAAGVFGAAIGGQGPLGNSFQVDGGENSNLYGQFAATPGGLINLISPPGGGGLRSVPLDAVQEIQVLVAPFDVRQGSFTGGLINAVTKSGTNTTQGSGFLALQNRWLAGRDLEGHRLPNFHTLQFGGTLGGPIVRDRLHVFLSADLQESLTPYGGPLLRPDTAEGADSAGIGIRFASALRFQRILADTYRVEAGGLGAIDTPNPAQSLFGKLTFQAGVNSRVELSQSLVRGVIRGFLASRDPYGTYGLTSTDGRYTSVTTATRATWNTLMGGTGANELIVAYLATGDRCSPAVIYPLVTVYAEEGSLQAGRSPSCPGQALIQHALEFTDNVTLQAGAHRLLAGTHEELLAFNDPTSVGSEGAWTFASLDDFAAGRPIDFTRATTGALRAEGRIADFHVRQLGLYLQDEWAATPRLTLTAGIRVDLPLFPDRPVRNPELLASVLNINTGRFPGGRALWSPRLAATYTPGSATLTLRAGAGLFTGRPPYFLPADAYRSTGLEQYLVVCSGEEVPDFTLEPLRQPTRCRSSDAIPVPRISFVDPSFSFPQELKFSAGADARLPWDMQVTIDLLVSLSRHQAELVDVNLAPTGEALSGEGGRPMYGTLDAAGVATPNRPADAFASVVRQGNGRGNRYASVSISLSRALGARGEIIAAYTYGESWDRMNPPGGLGISLSGLGVAADQIGGAALDGTLEHRRLARSVNDVPHKLRLSGTVGLPLGAMLSLIYEGSSGSPFTYVVDGDINGDGFGPERIGQQSNDPVYVPRSPGPGGDLALVDADGSPATGAAYATLARYIEAESCLRHSRGALLRRNTCRNPWRTQLDARLARPVRLAGGRSLGLSLDLFNLLHLLDSDWGLVRRTADFGLEEVPLVRLAGFDALNQRGVYQLRLPTPRLIDGDASRWRMQLGARLDF